MTTDRYPFGDESDDFEILVDPSSDDELDSVAGIDTPMDEMLSSRRVTRSQDALKRTNPAAPSPPQKKLRLTLRNPTNEDQELDELRQENAQHVEKTWNVAFRAGKRTAEKRIATVQLENAGLKAKSARYEKKIKDLESTLTKAKAEQDRRLERLIVLERVLVTERIEGLRRKATYELLDELKNRISGEDTMSHAVIAVLRQQHPQSID